MIINIIKSIITFCLFMVAILLVIGMATQDPYTPKQWGIGKFNIILLFIFLSLCIILSQL